MTIFFPPSYSLSLFTSRAGGGFIPVLCGAPRCASAYPVVGTAQRGFLSCERALMKYRYSDLRDGMGPYLKPKALRAAELLARGLDERAVCDIIGMPHEYVRAVNELILNEKQLSRRWWRYRYKNHRKGVMNEDVD